MKGKQFVQSNNVVDMPLTSHRMCINRSAWLMDLNFSEIILASDSTSSIVTFQSSPYSNMTTPSKTSHVVTPPQSPEIKAKDPTELLMALKIAVDLLARKGASLDEYSLSPPPPPPPPPPNTPKEPSTERVRASKVAYRSITET